MSLAKRISTRLLLFIFTLCLLLMVHTKAYTQTRLLYTDTSNINNEIQNFSFFSKGSGYVSFSKFSYSIGFTADSGKTIIKKPITNTNVDFNGFTVNLTFGFVISGVKAFDQNNLLVYGDYGAVPAILQSTNGGNSYKLIYLSGLQLVVTNAIKDMNFPENNLVGFAVDEDRVIKTTNGGLTWAIVREVANTKAEGIIAVDNNTLFIYGTDFNQSKILRSVNGGITWEQIPIPLTFFSSLFFLNSTTGWLNYEGRIWYTRNAGQSWIQMNPLTSQMFTFHDIVFMNDSTGFAGGSVDNYKTTDTGKIWEIVPKNFVIDSRGSLARLHFFKDKSQFWSGGQDDYIGINTQPETPPNPTAIFSVDTIGLIETGIVKLNNFSRTHHSFKWYKNGILLSTSYNANYVHDVNNLRDTIRLEATNSIGATSYSIVFVEFYPPVTITNFSPASAGEGAVVTITGTNFENTVTVSFGGVPASSFTVESPTLIKAYVGNGADGEIRVVTLRNAAKRGGFTFIPRPSIVSVTPSSAPAGALVTISGSNFTNVSAVSIGAVPVTSFTIVSPNIITAIVPSGPSGVVIVTTPGGAGGSFNFINQPTISTFTPTSGTFGTYITISGTSLTDINAVTIGGLPVDSFYINSSTNITAVASSGNTGNIQVSKAGASFSLGSFTWYAPPVITSYSPLSGPVGTPVTITGSGFEPNTVNNIVYFGTIRAVVTASSANSLTVVVPYGTTYQPISVTTHNLTSISNSAFHASFANGGAITKNSFSTKITIPLDPGYYPASLLLGDIDADGKQDIVYGNYFEPGINQSKITILHNTSIGGAITFSRIDIPFAWALFMKLADIDGDGLLDIIAANGTDNAINILLNKSTIGNISFQDKYIIPNSDPGEYILIKDFDKDGKLDIITGRKALRNIGEVGKPLFVSTTELLEGHDADIADLDGDGSEEIHLDAASSNARIIYRNLSTKGSIKLDSALWYPIDFVPFRSITADFDNDNKPDLISPLPVSHEIALIRNQSTPGNFSFGIAKNYSASYFNSTPLCNDLDGDGLVDIAAGHSRANLAIFKNITNAEVLEVGDMIDQDSLVFFGYNELASTDLNSDGKPEIITASYSVKAITIYINDVKPEPFIRSFSPTIGEAGSAITLTGSNFSTVSSVSFGGVLATSFTINSPTSITAIISSGNSGDVRVVNNVGSASKPGFIFGYPPAITAISPRHSTIGTDVVISGNHFRSLASENIVYFGSVKGIVKASTINSITVTVPPGLSSSPVSVTANNKTGFAPYQFQSSFPGGTGSFTQGNFERLNLMIGGRGDVCDLDNDGKPDIINSREKIYVLRNTSGIGLISFDSEKGFAAGGSFSAFDCVAIDVDGDGLKDIVTIDAPEATISVLKNISTTNNIDFAAKVSFVTGPTSGEFVDIDAADIDNDGRIDIILSDYYGKVVLLKNETNNGQIRFVNRRTLTADLYIFGTTLGDIDGDGLTDIISTGGANQYLVYWKNTSQPGSISFSVSAPIIGFALPSNCVQLADFDNDGKLDLVTTNSSENSIFILKNTSTVGSISFAANQNFACAELPRFANVGDLDGDGKIDIIIQNQISKNFSVFKNTSTNGIMSFLQKVDYDIEDEGGYGSIVDFDGDGKPDILARTYSTFQRIFLNKTGISANAEVCSNGNYILNSNIISTTYQWQQNSGNGFINTTDNSIISGSLTTSLQLTNIPASWDGYEFRCLVNSNQYSTKYKLVIIGSLVVPSVSISSSTTSACVGTAIDFIAIPLNSGNTPLYQWQVNNQIVGSNTPTYSSNLFNNNDIVKVKLTSSDLCAQPNNTTSNSISLTINQPSTPTINITGNNTVIAGQSVIISSSATQGGLSPTYYWQDSTRSHSWTNITGANNNTLSYQPANTGDKLRCVYTSNANCVTTSQVVSNTIQFTINTTTAIVPVIYNKLGLRIFPNPVSNTLVVDSLKRSDSWQTAEFISSDGKHVFHTTNIINQTKVIINLSKLKPGVYYLVLRRKKGLPAYVQIIKL